GLPRHAKKLSYRPTVRAHRGVSARVAVPLRAAHHRRAILADRRNGRRSPRLPARSRALPRGAPARHPRRRPQPVVVSAAYGRHRPVRRAGLAMQVLYEEEGELKVGAVLSQAPASLQVESPHGRRTKIKAANVLLEFERPTGLELLAEAQRFA